jgi:NIMA (never in mitosis gene a)-related kinase
MDGFKILSKVGEGSYSTVLKVQRIEDGNIYALKRVKFKKLSDKEKQNALNEIRILASIKDKNVISYKEAFFDEKDSSLGIVMEYADKGDLFQVITERKKTKNYFDEQEIWKTFVQLLKGLKSLHDLNILHRDIKSANVFLFEGGICKLGDLNVSKVARKGLGYTQTGTPYYASPEVWEEQPYDSKSDIWSLGCVIYEMATLRPPFQAQSMEELYKKVMRGIYPKISSKYSEDLSDVLKLMIQVEVGARPSCEELLKMPMIYKRIEFFNENKDLDINNEQMDSVNQKFQLLKTINVPKKLENLGKNLPKPNYNTETNKSFQNNESASHKKYGGLTLNADILPNVKKQSIQKNRNVLKKNDDIKDEDDKISDIINNSNGSINSQPRRYANEERIPKSVPKNKKYESNHHIINNSNDNINKYIILPNLYSNRLGANNKNNSPSPKKSINLVKKKNINGIYKVPNNVKIIDGRNINGSNKNIISIKSGDKKVNLLSDDYAKMLLDKNSGYKSNNSKLNDIYNLGVDERNFLRILQQKKKRMMYIGKV